MPAAGGIKAVDILEVGGFGLETGVQCPAPDLFGLDGLAECLDSGVMIAVAIAADGRLHAVLAQSKLRIYNQKLAFKGTLSQVTR